MKAQRDLGVPIPADAIKDYERVKDRIDLASIAKRERADAARRQGPDRGVLGAGPAAVHPPRAHEPGPDRERRAAADFRSLKLVQFKAAAALLRPRPPGRGPPRPDDHRPDPQRAGPAHDARQAPGDVRPGAAGGLRPARGADRPLPGPRPQGRGRHPARPADPPRRPRREGRRASRAGS